MKKENNFRLLLEFVKWYVSNRKWQSRIILVTICLSIYSGDIYEILEFVYNKFESVLF